MLGMGLRPSLLSIHIPDPCKVQTSAVASKEEGPGKVVRRLPWRHTSRREEKDGTKIRIAPTFAPVLPKGISRVAGALLTGWSIKRRWNRQNCLSIILRHHRFAGVDRVTGVNPFWVVASACFWWPSGRRAGSRKHTPLHGFLQH